MARKPSKKGKGFSVTRGIKKLKRAAKRLTNVEGRIGPDGRFHPFRGSEGYNEFLAGDFEKRSRKKPLEALTLSEYVRRAGGLKDSRDHNYAGELRRFTRKESGTTGLINSKSGQSPESMAESAREDGFLVSDDPNEFLELLDRDLNTKKKVYHPAREWVHNPARAKKMRSEPLFDLFAAGTGEKKVGKRQTRQRTAALRVYDRHSKQEGSVLKVLPGGWLRVKLDNASVPHLIQRSELRLANPFFRPEDKAQAKKVRRVGVSIWKGTEVQDRKTGRKGVVGYGYPEGDKTHLEVFWGKSKKPDVVPSSSVRLVNPWGGKDEPGDIFREFHGKEPSGEEITLLTRTGVPASVDVLGSLVEIKFVSERKPLTFSPGQAWLGAYGTGGRRRLVLGLTKLFKMPAGYEPGKEYDYGEVEYVVYSTSKPHIYKAHRTGKEAEFIHHLGEEGGRKPRLILKDGIIFFRGGDYTIEAAGIRD